VTRERVGKPSNAILVLNAENVAQSAGLQNYHGSAADHVTRNPIKLRPDFKFLRGDTKLLKSRLTLRAGVRAAPRSRVADLKAAWPFAPPLSGADLLDGGVAHPSPALLNGQSRATMSMTSF
jgi:hypothetical protein